MKKNLLELNSEELTKRKSLLVGCLAGFGILVVFAAFLLVFFKAKSVLFVPLFVFPIILMPVFILLKSVNDELRSRSTKDSTKR
ncbi:hypothetical protein D3C71_663400 [compost metagenome]